MPDLIEWGNQYNIPLKVYYMESDSETANVDINDSAGTMAIVNESGNFHILMKNRAGTWNVL